MNRYLFAVSVTAAAAGFGLLQGQLFPAAPHPLVVPLIAAVVVAAWSGGCRAGLLSTALGSLALMFFAEPRFNFRIDRADDRAALLSLVVAGLVGCWVRAITLSDRPPDPPSPNTTPARFWWLGGFAAANLVAAGVGQGLKLIPGVEITFWPPAGIFVAALLLTDRRTWPWWVAAAGAAELAGNAVWFHNPPHLAVLYFAANTATAVTAALLVKRAVGGASRVVGLPRLEAPRNAALFALLAGVVAPVVGATVIATADAVLGKHAFGTAWPLVWLGDGTGLLLSAPLTLAAAHAWRHRGRIRVERAVEFAGTCGLTLLLAWLALRGHLPTVYVALPAVVWAAVRFQLRGAWAVLTAVVLAVAVVTRSGQGEFAGPPDQMAQQVVALQAFLGVAASTALVVAGLSTQYARALARLRAANQFLEQRVLARTAALRESEVRFRLAADAVNGIIYEYDLATGRADRSRGVYEVLGYRPDEVPPTADWWRDQVHPDDRPVGRWRAERIAAGEVPDVQYRVRHKDGRWLYVEDRAVLIRDGDGKPVRMVGCTVDITARKQAELHLARERERLGLALSAGRLGVYEWRVGEETVWWSPETYAVFGVDPATFRPTVAAFSALVHPDDADALWRKTDACLGRRDVFEHEYRVVRPGGEVRWVYNRSTAAAGPDGRPERLTGVIADVTDRKRAEEVVRDSERRLAAILDQLPVGVGVMGFDGRVTLANPLMRRFVPEHIPSLDPARRARWRAWGPDGSPLPPDEWPGRRAVRGEAVVPGVEFLFADDDGREVWTSVTTTPLRDASGDVAGAVVVIQDIDARKRAEETLRFQLDLTKSITDNATTAIFMMDDRSRCTFMNPAAERMTGFRFREVEGGILHDFIHHHRPDGRPYPMPDCPIDRALPAGGDVRDHEDVFFRKTGEPFPVMCNARVVYEGGAAVGTVVEVRDVTAERRAADENARLVGRLREADRRKDEFLATLAHELRNPLAPIRNGVQIIKMSGPNGAAGKTLETMDRQLVHLVHLIDDLLDVSRITQGKLHLRRERVTLQAVVEAAVEAVMPLVAKSQHELTVMPVPAAWLDGDPTRLTQVVSNLLTNAAKYTERGGRITLAAKADGGEVVVSVKDTGIGIPPAMLARVFEMFSQVDRALEKTTGGLGIGLSLVKGLVGMHGGTVSAHSEGEGKGSEFTVRLPAADDIGEGRGMNGTTTTSTGRKLTILVVDDNEDAAESMATMLGMYGHEVRTAFDGEAGVAAAGEFRPQVAFLDLGMPKVNGYDAARRIRSEEWGRGSVLVALTGWGSDDDKRKCAEAGFDRHLTKPVNPQALTKLLAELTPVPA